MADRYEVEVSSSGQSGKQVYNGVVRRVSEDAEGVVVGSTSALFRVNGSMGPSGYSSITEMLQAAKAIAQADKDDGRVIALDMEKADG